MPRRLEACNRLERAFEMQLTDAGQELLSGEKRVWQEKAGDDGPDGQRLDFSMFRQAPG